MGQKRLILTNMLGGGALGVLAMAAIAAAFPPPEIKHPDDWDVGRRPYRPQVRGVHSMKKKPAHRTTKQNHRGRDGGRDHGSDPFLNRKRGLGIRWRA